MFYVSNYNIYIIYFVTNINEYSSNQISFVHSTNWEDITDKIRHYLKLCRF